MKHTFLYSLLLMIISAGTLFSQTTQSDRQGTTAESQMAAKQEHRKEIVKKDIEPVIEVNKIKKTAYNHGQLNHPKRPRCCSAHGHITHQKSYVTYRRNRLAAYKRRKEQTDAANKSIIKNQ